jgi:hypothetical protein
MYGMLAWEQHRHDSLARLTSLFNRLLMPFLCHQQAKNATDWCLAPGQPLQASLELGTLFS